MEKPSLYFQRLKNAYNKTVFAESFGLYLAGLNQADILDQMINSNGDFEPTWGAESILKHNEAKKDAYLSSYLEVIINADKNDILLLLQEKQNSETKKFDVFVKNIIKDIEILIKATDKLRWLKHNDIITNHLVEFTTELKRNYLNISVFTTDSDFKPLVWTGETGVLVDVFYKLYAQKTNAQGDFLISAKKQELCAFILKSFVKPDHSQFTESSILRNLNPDKNPVRNPIDLDR